MHTWLGETIEPATWLTTLSPREGGREGGRETEEESERERERFGQYRESRSGSDFRVRSRIPWLQVREVVYPRPRTDLKLVDEDRAMTRRPTGTA